MILSILRKMVLSVIRSAVVLIQRNNIYLLLSHLLPSISFIYLIRLFNEDDFI